MIEFLKGLEFVWLVWVGVTFALTGFSCKNYITYFKSLIVNKSFNQAILGRVIDWCWLASVFILTVKFI